MHSAYLNKFDLTILKTSFFFVYALIDILTYYFEICIFIKHLRHTNMKNYWYYSNYNLRIYICTHTTDASG